MAFAGLKKQINKANQYVTEKMGGAEGTKLDLDFMEMERKTDVTVELVEELQTKTKEYLQPNPTARAKMAAVKGISKLSGQAKSNTYPQPEGILADCMLTYGKKLGEDSIFAGALVEMGDSLKQMADVKYSLDDNIKQNFLEPLHQLQTKDLKEVMTRGSRQPSEVRVRPQDASGFEHRNTRFPGWDECFPIAIAHAVTSEDADARQADTTLLYGAIRFRAGEPGRAGFQGKRRHHAHPACGRELVRRQRQRPDRLFPAVVRAGHRSIALSCRSCPSAWLQPTASSSARFLFYNFRISYFLKFEIVTRNSAASRRLIILSIAITEL
ncbi:uncharacterized protein LOC134202499 isoform X6 [Armigeres subalbatus]|uniref:uncharacterized protein LOC134202499 isoform X6 n=1 Tax=Armigeres subalbatus TaxID=124917 RepID=UPI002ED0BBAE